MNEALPLHQARGASRSELRIGFHNPWPKAAEGQAFHSLRVAAARLGHQLFQVANTRDILSADLDFVIAVDPGLAKTTAVPTFGAIHSPRSILLQGFADFNEMNYVQNLLTYDGYLTIADTLHDFLDALCVGAGKPANIGYYYNTPQRQFWRCPVKRLAAAGELRLCYFGVNWEPRARAVFRSLSTRSYMRIYGPDEAWSYLGGAGYHGSVAFDGAAVQKVYAGFGAGLVTLSRQHALDDVISNRIFEITSVGAVAICPDIPWIRRHFGDTVWYYEPFAPAGDIVDGIDAAMAAIASDPAGAARRASAARAIFERQFAAEIMLQNAVDYFAAWRDRDGRARDPELGPAIDVIMPLAATTGPAELRRAINSIDSQRVGSFRLIVVGALPGAEDDLHAIERRRIERIDVVEATGESHAARLQRGLAAVSSPFFTVLYPGGFWLPDHIAGLLGELATCAPERGFAYSGRLRVAAAEATEADSGTETRQIATMVPAAGTMTQILERLRHSSFLAASGLLRGFSLDAAIPDSAAAALLQAALISRADTRFCHRAAIAYSEDTAKVDDEDTLEAMIRLHLIADRVTGAAAAGEASAWSAVQRLLHRIEDGKTRALSGEPEILALEGNMVVAPLDEREAVEQRALPMRADRLWLSPDSRLLQRDGEPALAILADRQPWAFGATLQLLPADLFAGPQWVVARFAPVAHPIAIGVRDRAGEGFQMRMQVPASARPVEAWVHIHDPADVSALVLQNWDAPAPTAIELHRLCILRELPAAAAEG